MQLKRWDTTVCEEIIHVLFGGSRTNVTNITANMLEINFKTPNQSISNVNYIRKGHWMSDLQYPDIAGNLFTGNRYEQKWGLVAIETILCWTLMGKLKENHEENPISSIVMSMFYKNESSYDLWSSDVLGISEKS